MRFLLDEHISPLVTARLRALGHDAVAVAERDGLRGGSDDRIREAAVAEDRVLVTYDVRDFGSMGSRMAAASEPHPGIVLVSSRRFPRRLTTLAVWPTRSTPWRARPAQAVWTIGLSGSPRPAAPPDGYWKSMVRPPGQVE